MDGHETAVSTEQTDLRIDPWLKTYNRAAYDADLPQFWKEHVSRGLPLSLVFVDVDEFKKFNDNFGHEVGDKVLEQTARILEAVVGNKGRVYRYGGDEFALLLLNSSLDEATSTAERARVEVSEVPIEGCTERITFSIGVANYPETTTNQAEFFGQADQALYVSKEAGRNQVTKAEADPSGIRRESNAGRRLTVQEVREFHEAAMKLVLRKAGSGNIPRIRISIWPERGVDNLNRKLLWASRLMTYTGGLFIRPEFDRREVGVTVEENPGPHFRYAIFGALPALLYGAGLEDDTFVSDKGIVIEHGAAVPTITIPGSKRWNSAHHLNIAPPKHYSFWQICRHLDVVLNWGGKLFEEIGVTGYLQVEVLVMNLLGHSFHLGITSPGLGSFAFSEANFSHSERCLPQNLVSETERHRLTTTFLHELAWIFKNSEQMSRENVERNMLAALRAKL